MKLGEMMDIQTRISESFERQKLYRVEASKKSVTYRVEKLKHFKSELISSSELIAAALEKDFGKANLESKLTEILPIISMINLTIKKLGKWSRPESISSSLLFFGAKSLVQSCAKGNCLVISPWNYPFQLALYPVLTSFSAGNTTILKPSEYTPNTNLVIKNLIEKVFLKEEVDVIEGDSLVSTSLLSLSFHHIFFTGSCGVGKIVMESAAKNLASVSLELGGKSPLILDPEYNLDDFAAKTIWGKFVNSGQTCVAPDYLLIKSGELEIVVQKLISALEKSYPSFRQVDYCQIITSGHARRLKTLVTEALDLGATIEYGQLEVDDIVTPIILSGVNRDMKIMSEEIFGPILPIVEKESIDEMIDYVNEDLFPLALYLFSKNKNVVEKVELNTNSGALSINETLLHVGHAKLPFGGTGASGIGKYHGKYGFEEFSNMRSVLHRKFNSGLSFFYPPYSEVKYKIVNIILRKFNRFL